MRRETLTLPSSVASGTVEPLAPPTTLKPVIDVLPDSVYDNPTWRGMMYFLRDAAMYLALLVVLVLVSNVFAVIAIGRVDITHIEKIEIS